VQASQRWHADAFRFRGSIHEVVRLRARRNVSWWFLTVPERAVDVLRALDDPSDPAQVTRALSPARTLGPGELDSLPADDVEESSVEEMDEALVLRRGAGVGARLGSAATQRVLDRGLTPQWRAAGWNDASRRIARRIGYREMGRQFSFQLAPRSDPVA
jgi:hypothetical protein